jgi:hypothetical protein
LPRFFDSSFLFRKPFTSAAASAFSITAPKSPLSTVMSARFLYGISEGFTWLRRLSSKRSIFISRAASSIRRSMYMFASGRPAPR